jgi:plasmid stabilization system protein ParE
VKLVFEDQALADLENIFNWIAQDSPAIASDTKRSLASSTAARSDHAPVASFFFAR